ncbi:MAG: hypothetical protein UR90_C0006G0009 [Parcubacteria group bacterium GW2011_GWC1_35_8]|uniref:Uncharacterized protein n=3 Tax=Candidatus Nomuraibacteriota TaxID=1752729 RepID=A0A1F6YWP1_9BACT|nr:MAG: hypothetical protein UR90_C0006G0009 [Parcubacteria group bacterium GW2011_GWC1_35_8]KKP88490.1 MAG: hypothetical protein UR91_C0017G0014 [Candidatus Nomurabacteria bacterium GW2011_GWC2_35_8]OGJ04722.1 MAG: hypothetical protein A2238_00990 [Candidatus Nomurabacteria bacterium RIFOXYA2_FULL_35_9]OGJ06626.1 MAG: hypothetical protein A2192_00815 [Candidatus Nomurabacteria bacterium RIFOXYA1_FULL_35_17]OGJ10776.1 MAG: hypothetical protein A2456_03005 [Candidatus Nomurabacteria bacterium RI
MKESPNHFNPIKKLGNVNQISLGADSRVFRVVNPKEDVDIVAKEYSEIKIKPEVVKEIIEQYYADTERAKKITNEQPNPLNQRVKIEDKIYSLEYRITSQGTIILNIPMVSNQSTRMWEIMHGIPKKKKHQEKIENKTSLGQEFIDGYDLNLLMNYEGEFQSLPKGITDAQEPFLERKELGKVLCSMIEEFFSYLSKILNINLSFDSINIKPFLDKRNGKITLIITDLASSLEDYYKNSPKFKKPKEK